MQHNSTDLFGDVPLKRCSKCKGSFPPSDFYVITHRIYGRRYRSSWCKRCSSKGHREKYANPEGRKAILASQRKNIYGITQAKYDAMIAAQGGLCAICQRPEEAKRRGVILSLAVDHCHSTGQVRGLVCRSCNSGLAQFRDSPERLLAAIEYLAKYQPGYVAP
jgi:hypothetical protein